MLYYLHIVILPILSVAFVLIQDVAISTINTQIPTHSLTHNFCIYNIECDDEPIQMYFDFIFLLCIVKVIRVYLFESLSRRGDYNARSRFLWQLA